MKRLNFQTKRLFITVKAYPTPSISYGETVCCAGIDIYAANLIRIYPLNYRDLDHKKRFKKYSLIEAECAKDPYDHRPESYRILQNSIKIIEYIDTRNNGWQRREEFIKNIGVKSFCQITQEEKINKTSLGIIKPEDITFSYEKRVAKNKTNKCYKSPGLFDKKKEPIEEIPYQFYYNFKCAGEANCPRHRLAIIDWEINQAFRKWRETFQDDKSILSQIEGKWMSIADTVKRNVLFFVGNLHRFRHIFTVLSVFYPPKNKI